MSLFGPESRFPSLSQAALGALETALRAALAREPKVRLAFLFGSAARGESFHDIDIGVELDEPFRGLELRGLSLRLWEAAGRPQFELDVVPLNDAPPSFREEVSTTGRVLFERWPRYAHDFAVQALSDIIDFRQAERIVEKEQG